MTQRIGISGSRQVPTRAQRRAIRQRLAQIPPGTTVIIGGCLGLDSYVARAVFAYCTGVKVHAIVPSDPRTTEWVDPDWRVWCHSFEVMPGGTTNRHRNVQLVNRSGRLLAWPQAAEGDPMSQRSGTWQTIRLARQRGIPVEVVVLSEILDT